MTARHTLDLLRAYESRYVTFVEPDGSWPIVWERAKGEYVWSSDGKRYLDLTAAFGVAATGHANPRVVRAGQQQMARLLHAMGDVHPHALKAKLAELRAIREDASLPEAERQAAAAQLTDLLRAHGRGGKFAGEAERAVDRVRKQVRSLIRELQSAESEVLREFGEHLEDYLWLPSVGGRKRIGAAGKAGCFTYEPPAGVRWCD